MEASCSRGKSCRFAFGRGWPPGFSARSSWSWAGRRWRANGVRCSHSTSACSRTSALRAPMRSARRAGRFGTRRRRGGGTGNDAAGGGRPEGVEGLSKGRARNPVPGREREPAAGAREVSREIGLSPFHAQRLFTRFAGVSPKRFLGLLTVGHAKTLLQDGQSVLDATYEVGLSGPSRLYDLFVTYEAMTQGNTRARARTSRSATAFVRRHSARRWY